MNILIAIVSGFASGVFLRSLFSFGWEPMAFALILAVIFAVARFIEPRRAYALGAAFCLFIVLGMMRSALADTPLPNTFARDIRQRVSYEGIVVADPDIRDANQRIEIRVSKDTESVEVLAVAPRSPTVSVGERVYVSGTLAVPKPFDDNGRIFHYDKYLQRDGIRFILNFAYLRMIEKAPWYSIPATLARMKHLFLNGLSAVLPEPHASLAGGVVIGGKSGLGKDLQNDFIRSGTIQIIVLSGYNVMIVAEWLMKILAVAKLPKRWNAVLGALAIIIFVGIAGASSTAIRAAIMAFIALYARATGRTYTAGRALLFAVFLMLIWNPLYLVYDPGFGLSVMATAGLIWLAPIIEMFLASAGRKVFESVPSAAQRNALKNFSPERVPSFWRNALATTLAAQIAVLPLLLYDTGNLSLVAIPANLLTMPVVPLTMGLSAIAGFAGIAFGTIAPYFGIIFAFPSYIANAYLIFIAHGAAELPLAAFTIPPFPFWLVLLSYSILIYIASSKRFLYGKMIPVVSSKNGSG